MCTISTPANHMRTSIVPSAHVLVVWGPTAPHPAEPLFLPVLFTRSRSAARWASRASSSQQPHGVYTSDTPHPRGPRAACNMATQSLAAVGWTHARGAESKATGLTFGTVLLPPLQVNITTPRYVYTGRCVWCTRRQGGGGGVLCLKKEGRNGKTGKIDFLLGFPTAQH